MTVRFHLLDALDEIPAPLKAEVMRELEAANARIAQLIRLERLDIVVRPGGNVIPELGLNGYADGPGLVMFTVDPGSERMGDHERPTRILGMLAHELHHVLRMRSGAWTATLGGRFVSEGLAQCFEEEVGAPTPHYAVALGDSALDMMAERARPLLSATDYDHDAWMFGRRDDPDWPRDAGYSLGYALVKAWLESNRMSAVDAVGVADRDMTDEWQAGHLCLSASPG